MNREEYEKSKIYYDLTNCPFCTKLNKSKILYENKYWFVIKNDYPYFWCNHHLLAIPKRHVSNTKDLTKAEFSLFPEIEKFLNKYYKNLWDYFSFIRQSKSNKSVEHLHYHYLLGIPSAYMENWKRRIKITL